MIDAIHKYERSQQQAYDFSILLPTWNNLDYLKLCISSIQKNSSLQNQIIVFVNEGKDGTLEWLNSQENIDYIHTEENLGICYALNLCRSLVKSEYIMYLNDDMYVLPKWDLALQKEISGLQTKAFMLSATMIEPTHTGNACVMVKDYGDSIETFKESLLLKEYAQIKFDDWRGSTWPPNVVHVSLWDMVGGLSIEYSPGMYSDPDFSKKLYTAGVRIFKGVAESRVYHFGSKSTKKLKKSFGRQQFLMKWGITPNAFFKNTLHIGAAYKPLQNDSLQKLDAFLGKLKILKSFFSSRRR